MGDLLRLGELGQTWTDLVHFTLREWTRMSTAPTEGEVERAKEPA